MKIGLRGSEWKLSKISWPWSSDTLNYCSVDIEFELPEIYTRSRGRPQSITDAELAARRDRLYGSISRHWMKIDPILRDLRSPEDVGKLFRAMGAEDTLIEGVLTREPKTPLLLPAAVRASTDAQPLVKITQGLRKRVSALRSFIRSESVTNDGRRDRLAKLDSALKTTMTEVQWGRAVAAQKRIKENLDRDQRKALDSQSELLDCQSFLIWCEFLRFVRVRRYVLSPIRLANAIAGLPEIGFRQSSTRCRVFEVPAGATTDEQYKALQKIVGSSNRRSDLVQHAESWLRATPPSKCEPVKLLRRKWYYLKRAIEDIDNTETQPRDLATAILEQFLHRQADASPVDRLFEEDEQITRKRRKIEL